MPSHLRPDAKPVVQFDPILEISPFVVFRRLREGRRLLLVDVRRHTGGRTLHGARLLSADFEPPGDVDTVLFDEDGIEALTVATRLQELGHPRVKALFGGLDLYQFALDPEVVGTETYLVSTRTDDA